MIAEPAVRLDTVPEFGQRYRPQRASKNSFRLAAQV
jgi:hypothetical protein